MLCGVHRHGGRTTEPQPATDAGNARRVLPCWATHARPIQLLLLTAVHALVLGCESRKVIKAHPLPAITATDESDPNALPAREPPVLDPSADAPTCGTDSLPECPLQYWMDHRLSGPLTRQDFPSVARSFRDLANAEPPGYAGWRLWAQGGAAAADREDVIGIRRACSGCHDTYRERYRRTIRARPMQIVDPP
jgi:hypothetical protein